MDAAASQSPSLRLLICLKQVRLPESPLELSEGRLLWPGAPLLKMSNADEFALEEGLCLKDSTPGLHVTVLTLGPASADSILRRALGMGADAAAHLLAPEDSLRPNQVAAALAAWAAGGHFDLILCGAMSEDAMNGVVGPWMARLLGLPCLTSVIALEAEGDAGLVRAQREMGGGQRQALELPLPALLTIQSSLRTPRYPTLSGLLKAKKAALPSTPATELISVKPSAERVGMRQPLSRRAGLRLEGNPQEKAARLHEILRQRSLL